MIQQIEKILRRWGLIAPFDADDVINATIEDKARDTDQAVSRLKASLSKQPDVNARLRHSILIAKHRTNSFEDFERFISGRTETDD
jgi:hypothetical protein